MYSLLNGAQEATGTTIIIDVYRAFTTAAVAFSRGAKEIILVSEIEEAISLRAKRLGELCVGEVDGIKPDMFDLGNSPHEMSSADVNGKTLIQSTRAGTVGVNAAMKAEKIYAGALVTAAATTKSILNQNPETVSIVAMGAGGKNRTDEDEQCGLYIKNLLQGRSPDKLAVLALIEAGEESQKFGNPHLPHFHTNDKKWALDIDCMNFAIVVSREKGLLIARPEYGLH
jgi:2-phosphosulfolactate phosphatase